MISIIIPLYNEEENVLLYPKQLIPVAESIIRQYGEDCEFVFVDDGSRDNTLERLNALKEGTPHVTVVPHGTNKGMGAAIRTGLAHARGHLIITMDSDLTYRPEDIDTLLAAYRDTKADCISASPYRGGDHANEVSSPFRLFISRAVNFLYRLLLGNDITCVSGIFRLYKKEALLELTLRSNNFEIDAEIISKLILGGRTVREVGVKLHEREYGESKLDVKKEVRNNLKILSKIFRARLLKESWD
ncbi:MAG: glycosyltransferase family 2 protein [Methanomicrobiales archaeon]|jgi:dolichol-phosphate mannosyltransferase